ncbi:hypothetical protein H6F77_00265 [Microcoleus sp. FACHB-831]|jgi:hypothetical protein|uniref:hypothetical protein n=1 Tax=Microcoleus sp. FACHB-831 TaxID=2692827 RepID=UPI00168707B9|nr:hypothetical protein [Microcoleus sp. FACHB-831]MBD1919557.1 hypothetical protein [Microcoleus sp. FACHB-831]
MAFIRLDDSVINTSHIAYIEWEAYEDVSANPLYKLDDNPPASVKIKMREIDKWNESKLKVKAKVYMSLENNNEKGELFFEGNSAIKLWKHFEK